MFVFSSNAFLIIYQEWTRAIENESVISFGYYAGFEKKKPYGKPPSIQNDHGLIKRSRQNSAFSSGHGHQF